MSEKWQVVIITFVVIGVFCIANNILMKNNNENQYKNVSGDSIDENVEIIHITAADFEDEVLNCEKTVVVDFYADWCGPCKVLSPTIEKFANENPDIKVVKINIDEEEKIAEDYNIMYIPTLVFVKNGEEVDRTVGVVGKSEISKIVNKIRKNWI